MVVEVAALAAGGGSKWEDGWRAVPFTNLGYPPVLLDLQDYSEMSVAYRPSHADATYDFKYGIRAVAGGGRSSARETIGRVAAGAIAKKLLSVVAGTEVGLPG